MRKNRIHIGEECFDIAFKFGDFVYLRTNDTPQRGQVTGYDVQPGLLMYAVCWGPDCIEKHHYEFELSSSPFVQDTEDNESDEPEEETAQA